jgi:pimeloyl-ACP methyl ester carboxylesterase
MQAVGITDPYLRVVVEGWRTFCFTPELYAAKPEYIDSLADFVRSRPMPSVDAFLRQSDSELVVFEDCAHAPIYENVEEFNAKTLAFLTRHSG